MITGSGRRRSGGWFGYFLRLLIVFALGVYVGTKVDDSEMFSGEFFSWDSESEDVQPLTDTETPTESKKQYPAKVVDITENLIVPEQMGAAENEVSLPEDVVGENTDSIDGVDEPATDELKNAGNQQSAGIESGALERPGENDTILEQESELGITEEVDDEKKINVKTSYYTLQVAAFASSDDAKKVASGYIAKGYNAYIVLITNTRGETWNLIKIGKYSTIERAWDQAAIFKSSEGKEAFVENMDRDTVFNKSWKENMPSE